MLSNGNTGGQTMVSTNNNLLLSNNNQPSSLDHYKYIRSLLPNVPHMIETLNFGDLHSWEATVNASLRSESDCLKWLTDFGDNTKTDWRVDHDIAVSAGKGQQKVLWGMVYKCVAQNRKDCSAKLEMKILSQDAETKRNKQQHPCLISISFCHNHSIQQQQNSISSPPPSSVINLVESFKVQDVPSHLKEQFEGYFLPSSNASSSSSCSNTSVNIQQHLPQVVILPPSEHDSTFHSEVFSLEDVSQKLNEALDLLQTMLKRSGTACAAVKQFTDHFERLKADDEVLETALCNFGANLHVAHHPPVSQIVTNLPMLSPPQWSMAALTEVDHNQSLQESATSPPPLPILNTKASKKLKNLNGKKRKKPEPTVLPGQIDPVTGKRRKRSRCGTCQGCINRDKTQDCRECRNCLDQKRYGGPGRLKKACVKRSCAIMATPEGHHSNTSGTLQDVVDQQQQIDVSTLMPTTISLPMHPLPVSVSSSTSGLTLQQNVTLTDASSNGGVPAAVLSWPNGPQFAPTFHVQQPVQFTYQPQQQIGPPPTYAASVTTSLQMQSQQSLQLETIAAEAARHHGIS